MEDQSRIVADLIYRIGDTKIGGARVFYGSNNNQIISVPRELADGRIELTRLSRDLGLVQTHFELTGPPFIIEIFSAAGRIGLDFFLREGTDVVVEGERGKIAIREGTAAFSYFPMPMITHIPEGSAVRHLGILLSREFMDYILAEAGLENAAAIESRIDSPSSHFVLQGGISPYMAAAVSCIWSCPYSGSMRRLYLEAKVYELIVLLSDQLMSDGAAPLAPVVLSRTDIDHLYDARQLLQNKIRHPPSLSELAREVAINSKKLNYGFKEIFGTTVFGYLRNERLDRARLMLKEGELQVTEVAYLTGYKSLSHFAAAFKKEFGVCPHEYRRGVR